MKLFVTLPPLAPLHLAAKTALDCTIACALCFVEEAVTEVDEKSDPSVQKAVWISTCAKRRIAHVHLFWEGRVVLKVQNIDVSAWPFQFLFWITIGY